MSKHDSNDLDMAGYFLPEHSHFRLKTLRDRMRSLSHPAQPRTRDQKQACEPRPRPAELTICLELLAEQLSLVLEEASWPARPAPGKDAPGTGTAIVSAEDALADADDRFAFGVTLKQIDALDRLIQTISAQGDVMAAGKAAELADHTLPLLGQAICDGVKAVRNILDQVEAQRLGHALYPRADVGEDRAVYETGAAGRVMDDPVRPTPPPAYPFAGAARSILH